MVNDEVGIYNLALNQTGVRDNVTITTEASREAEVCRLWYPVVRDQVLRAAHWPSARKVARLALLSTAVEGDWTELLPEPGYAYCYSQPADMLYPRSLTTYEPFIVNNFGTVPAITTNTAEAILLYTFRQTVVARWESSLQSSIAFGLAAHICMPLTGKQNRAKMLLDQANSIVTQAQLEAANEGNYMLDTLPDWIAARGYCGGAALAPRYLYPFGSKLGISGGIPSSTSAFAQGAL